MHRGNNLNLKSMSGPPRHAPLSPNEAKWQQIISIGDRKSNNISLNFTCSLKNEGFCEKLVTNILVQGRPCMLILLLKSDL